MEAEITVHTSLPIELIRELQEIKKQYTRNILPSVRCHRYFLSQGQRRKNKRQQSIAHYRKRLAIIRFSPFAMTLGHGVANRSHQAHQPNISTSVPRSFASHPMTQPNELVSVFIVGVIQSSPELFVIQKIQCKPAPGFFGGGIEKNETILDAATREFKEESRGKDQLAGIDIGPYNPLCIGKFTLDRATNSEQGAVVLAEIPEKEMAKIVAGGGDQEEEIVEKIYFLTFEEVSEMMINGPVLPNAKKVWQIYLEYLVS